LSRPTPGPDAGPAFDEDDMLARVSGDRQLLAELVDMFLEEWPKTMVKLRGAFADGDAHTMERAAHNLRGALGALRRCGVDDRAID
jgi:HPt (histidine-containing phosphotransfer) domain-containing protein